MLTSLICKLTSHKWELEDLNEVLEHMDLGDEATLRCERCNKQIVTVEKTTMGLKWQPHDKESVLYELTPKGKKAFSTEMLRRGANKDLDKFREENK